MAYSSQINIIEADEGHYIITYQTFECLVNSKYYINATRLCNSIKHIEKKDINEWLFKHRELVDEITQQLKIPMFMNTHYTNALNYLNGTYIHPILLSFVILWLDSSSYIKLIPVIAYLNGSNYVWKDLIKELYPNCIFNHKIESSNHIMYEVNCFFHIDDRYYIVESDETPSYNRTNNIFIELNRYNSIMKDFIMNNDKLNIIRLANKCYQLDDMKLIIEKANQLVSKHNIIYVNKDNNKNKNILDALSHIKVYSLFI